LSFSILNRNVVKARLLLVLALLLACTACLAPKPTVKIALVAPFEGRLRQIGYGAFPAMRLAIRQAATEATHVMFIAYNDDGDPAKAARIAHNVARDPEVVAVIGHLALSTTLAALAVYTQAGLPVIVPTLPAQAVPFDPLVFRLGPDQTSARYVVRTARCDLLDDAWSATGLPPCASDAPPVADLPAAQRALAGFTEISLGPPPGPRAIVAYDATMLVIRAIQQLQRAGGQPTRASVAAALRRMCYDGLLGQINFDARNTWASAPLWIYPSSRAGTSIARDRRMKGLPSPTLCGRFAWQPATAQGCPA
jgi:ABC-type branched-subunit amino acid transport system substrate-binding protein